MPLGVTAGPEAGDADEETAFLLGQSDLESPGPHAASPPNQNPGTESRKGEESPEMPMLAEGEAEKAFFDVSNSQANTGLLIRFLTLKALLDVETLLLREDLLTTMVIGLESRKGFKKVQILYPDLKSESQHVLV